MNAKPSLTPEKSCPRDKLGFLIKSNKVLINILINENKSFIFNTLFWFHTLEVNKIKNTYLGYCIPDNGYR